MQYVFIRNAAALALAAAALPCWAVGTVEVTFTEATKYTDAGFGKVEVEQTTGTLGEHLKSYAKKLADGQTLKIDVLDVDLAGRIEPGSARDLRVVTGRADWPKIKLRYTLLAGGSTLKSGEENLADMNYLERGRPRTSVGGLEYERRMLDDWFKQRFAAH